MLTFDDTGETHLFIHLIRRFICAQLLDIIPTYCVLLAVDETCSADGDCVANSECDTSSKKCMCKSGYTQAGYFCSGTANIL